MREIDLIPKSYRADRARSLFLTRLGVTVAVLVLATGAVRLWLDSSLGRVRTAITGLEAQQAITTEHRERLAALSTAREEYQRQLHLLTGLRSGTSERNLFRIIDDAMPDDSVWFREWQFRRAGVTNAEGQAVETGYFIVVPAGEAAPSWQVETHMTIAGQAVDHAALSEFVQRLLGSPEIETVRIRRSEQQRYGTRSIVDFDLAIVINRQELG